jgi:SAM-dependent methyltransferase
MEQTPAHERHNPDLLALLPRDARALVEVGCSSGALAREYKKLNQACTYIGIEVVSEYARLARRHCDLVLELDIESADDQYLRDHLDCSCWIFGDTLEHLREPWSLLARIRKFIPAGGSVVACIPNAQHWSVQARLNCGLFRYEEGGLLDRSHLRWFTRTTIEEMFQGAGFSIVEQLPRVFDEPDREAVFPAIRLMAQCLGTDPDAAIDDALPLQYVVRAVPA